MKEMIRWIGVLFVFGVILSAVLADPDPMGATIIRGESSRGTDPTPLTTDAEGGNTTQLNIDQKRLTRIWQGFFGNVSGQIVLENAAGAMFYDWSVAEVSGEIYSTRNTVADWSNINCTNSTQWEAEETALNIPVAATDGINETYSQTSHPTFDVAGYTMTGCRSVRPYNGTAEAGDFWNVLLNSNTSNVVYVSLLAAGRNAFDNTSVDFQLLVPVDVSVGQSSYYFYVELN